MEKKKNLFHFIVYKDFKVKSDFIKAILFTGITTVLLNGVIDRSRTVAVVVRGVEDVDGGRSIEVGDLDSVLGAMAGVMGFSIPRAARCPRWTSHCQGPAAACAGLCSVPGWGRKG